MKKHVCKISARIHVPCEKHAEQMHYVKPCYIVRDARVRVATSGERTLSVNEIQNAIPHHLDRMMYRLRAIPTLIVMNHYHVDLVSAPIHVTIQTLHVNQIKSAKHDAIDRCVYANLVSLLMNTAN